MIPKLMQSITLPVARAEASRRQFLLGALAAGTGVAIGYRILSASPALAGEAATESGSHAFSPYLTIGGDGKVTVLSSQFEMGQGSYNGIATLVAEELDSDWSAIDVIGAAGNIKAYGNIAFGGTMQGTGGSTSMSTSWERYRRAGAAARAMLVAAAAAEWGVDAAEIAVENGVLSHPSGKSGGFGAFAAKAATMPVPADVKLKEPGDWKLIGNAELKRFDSARKANGTEQYTIDVKLPGMLTAVMIHPPLFGAKAKSFDASAARAIKGVVDVVETPRGIAVVGEHMWAAIKGREAVTVEWDETGAEKRGTPELMSTYRDLARKSPAAFARKDGDTDAAFTSAAKVIEATFEFPYLAHAALEPLNAVARRNDDGTIEIWGGHQLPDVYQNLASEIAGVPVEKVRLNVMKTGGSFGRRAVFDGDVVVEAVHVAKALGFRAPVKVQWTREEDTRAGRYRPAYVHRLKAGIDEAGKLVAWSDHIVGQSIMAKTAWDGMVQNGVDPTSVEGANNLPYAIANQTVGLTTTDVRVPVLWWRSVGSTHTAFAAEAFLDEVAEAAGRDPLEFRLSMLEPDSRHATVLKLAAEKAEWQKPLSEGRFRGVAVAESFGSVVAQIAEVSVDGDGIKVERVVAAVDCGLAINPDQVRAQVEGGIGFGLSAILGEEITLTDGKVDQGNFDMYTPLRIDAMPKVEVHIVASANPPSGIGEPGVPPIGPAVANAAFKALGKRIRVMPFAKSLNA
ncbi:xanthine dehydrogenase family protein molybdopterin-binding subunit [Sinorhizobium meliloti]|uniref:xanthine dehydrogenase family protein molybdopterin-binding subunit n=1 Tax=Rhizobium meliloti TaxID=382 RepID=UPI0001E4EA3A|nr:xanthine dehydrogenase family protein molybdopterin-binding subunit [Sinorhizobium meliloti]AEG55537.1 Isoquinoline 1-oxidoreductase [Sinorhizobium meliloti AK83]MDE4588701.1 xanthine dehydrogenase family protein molybdopterin-binding subunit [Sinorhizobium meliloti]RVG95590.1 xanthine dehydrogenase family protein molybdopterin-binding subunit [Sinorhizobium meliloti]RVN59486.1 xanthine dehydrogenase family protein molybdopterin-binding subunit [Sinorhizobium meliloti]RVO62280.1 xanthine de